jgi:hypothetical protein
MLMQSAVNNIPHFVPSTVANTNDTFSLHASLAAWLTVGFLWITAAYFLVRMPEGEQLHGVAIMRDPRNDASVA